jgi:hypothetical protein
LAGGADVVRALEAAAGFGDVVGAGVGLGAGAGGGLAGALAVGVGLGLAGTLAVGVALGLAGTPAVGVGLGLAGARGDAEGMPAGVGGGVEGWGVGARLGEGDAAEAAAGWALSIVITIV